MPIVHILMYMHTHGTHAYMYTAKKLIAVHHVFTSLEDDPESVRDEFNMFLTTILTNYKDSQDREELQIVGSK